ncbi:MAG: S8 family peptidase [Mobilitalea sp.]
MRRRYELIAIVICSVFILGSDTTNESDSENIIYSISSTMGISAANTEDSYLVKQWALENDGSFAVQVTTPIYDGEIGDITTIQNPNNTVPSQVPSQVPNQVPNAGAGGGGNRRSNFFKMHSMSETADTIELAELGEANVVTNAQRTISYYGYSNTTAVQAVEDVDIDASSAWSLSQGANREVIIALIDTGVDYTNEELSEVIWTNNGETANDGIDNDKNGYIDDVYGWDFYNNTAFVYNSRNASEYDHGTHGAGSIGAAINNIGIEGIASDFNIKIMIVKALGGSGGYGDAASVVKAIQYAEAMGADICNMSFGTTTYDEELEQAVADSDMLFVCAAGNGDRAGNGVDNDVTPLYPASFDLDNVISVANLNFTGELDSSSNYGDESVDIAAPGAYILSTIAAGKYGYMSGTSMSAPMVTAVTAMTYSYYKDITMLEAKAIVLSSTEQLDSLQGKVSSGGILNAYNALTSN